MKSIYLDTAAATPTDPRVVSAMQPYLTDLFYNPSATYLAARNVKKQLDEIRGRIAQTIGARPGEIIFTAGATEANNLAIQGVARRFPGKAVLVSSIEHQSVLAPAELFEHKEIPVDKHGQIILNKLSNLITDTTVLVSVMLVNNEIGTVQPLREISEVLEQVRRQRLTTGNKLPIYLHSDAAQAGNYLDLHVSRLGLDLMSLNGAKLYGPKQAGVLYVKAGTLINPLIVGGGQEFGLRSGTENLAAAAGMAKALQIAQQSHARQAERVTKLRKMFENELKSRIPDAIVNGPANRAPHVLSLTLPGWDNERLMMELDEAGIMCAVGSACSAGHGEASHVLSAIGLSEAEARSTLRFSLGRNNTEAEIKKTVRELARLTQK